MTYFAAGYRLPKPMSRPLFGDRDHFGYVIDPENLEWQEWESHYMEFYQQTQRSSVGKVVNDAGYKILREIDLTGKKVLEIGPGDLPHLKFWNGTPKHFTMVDVQQEMLDRSAAKLTDLDCQVDCIKVQREEFVKLPFESGQFDLIISFYTFEHLYPFPNYLEEMLRILGSSGQIAGAFPCEGGLAWGAGRYLTTRRWLLKNTNVDPALVVSWEHPNFADGLLNELSRQAIKRKVSFWPLRVPLIDINLVASFIYQKNTVQVS